ncbi:hypothetical protein ACMFMG_004790 [Clarireedia jacksonii]
MRPRVQVRRIPVLRPIRPPNTISPRLFTQNSLRTTLRPQLPFLTSPLRKPPSVRYISTETKQWLKGEFIKTGKYLTFAYVATYALMLVAWGAQQEWLNHQFPSPDEWSWKTRTIYRMTMDYEDTEGDSIKPINWPGLGVGYREILKRLEDPQIDGAGLEEQDEGGILVPGVGKAGYDITKRSENWRRGYYGVLMGAAKAAEHLDGWVRDTKRDMMFAGNQVIGPSNPKPRPVSVGSPSAPREEDCEVAYDPPETFYMRILTTKGFTEKQRLDAALAYASWLDFKKTPEAAYEMHKWAIDIATSSNPSLIDSTTYTLNTNAGLPSQNLLDATTALGIHYATNSNISKSLPIFLSVLRARKSLPATEPTMLSTLDVPEEQPPTLYQTIMTLIKDTLSPPAYPPPPSDGTSPPSRDPKELCEEAVLMAHIGEILYTSSAGMKSKEDGLAWTREAVDVAEEELRKGRGLDKDGRKVCRGCLEVGLTNWETMVRKLVREEKEKKQGTKSTGWLGSANTEATGRWEAEANVIHDRIRRAREVLPGRIDIVKEPPKRSPVGGGMLFV